MSSSIGMIRNQIYGKIKNGNQTTNQLDSGILTPRTWDFSDEGYG